MKTVPFYPNDESDLRCMLANYHSVLDYFLGEKLSWDELDKLTGFQEGRAAWSLTALTKMAKMGLDITMIEPFDYGQFADAGAKYLQEFYSEEELSWMLNNSNILEIKPAIPEFLRVVKPEFRIATMHDIDALLEEDRLVFVELNSRKLYDRPGFVAHSILLHSKTDDTYTFHDPGLPPRANVTLPKSKIHTARGGDNSPHEVTGFKLSQ